MFKARGIGYQDGTGSGRSGSPSCSPDGALEGEEGCRGGTGAECGGGGLGSEVLVRPLYVG